MYQVQCRLCPVSPVFEKPLVQGFRDTGTKIVLDEKPGLRGF
jgi:hypothetical protein